MKDIDINKLSDNEIIEQFGPAAQMIIKLKNDNKIISNKLSKTIDKLSNTENKLDETKKKLSVSEAKLAEANLMIQQLYEAIDNKNYKLLKQLKDRFAPGTKVEYVEGIDEEYTEKTPRIEKVKQKVGRKVGTRNGDHFDFSNVELKEKVVGTQEGECLPDQFYKVDYIPGKAIVTKYTVYSNGEMPDQFGDSFLTPSLAGYIASRKFQYCLPLYRIETMLKESGVPISRVQLADYCMTISDELEPISNEIISELCKSKNKVVHADETSLKVIRASDGSKKTCRMFVFATTKWEEHQAAVYNFEVDRTADRIIKFFTDYKGTVICDDYSGYDCLERESLNQIKLARCWFHWRKRFEDIVLLVKKASIAKCQQMKTDKEKTEEIVKADLAKSYAMNILNIINSLFDIEKKCVGKSADELLKVRQKESKPIVEKLFAKLKKDSSNMKDPILEAVNYGLKLENDLKTFLDDPYVEMSNNRCERAVKDFVMTRKNYLFSYSEEGARAAGIIMTVVRTARLNGLDPEKYISYVLKQFSTKETSKVAMSNLKALLPWSTTLPKELKGNLKKLPIDIEKEITKEE